MQEDEFLDIELLSGVRRDVPLNLPWPSPGNPGGFISFETATQWRTFVLSLNLPSGIPEIVAVKYRRAQMLYFLADATTLPHHTKSHMSSAGCQAYSGGM